MGRVTLLVRFLAIEKKNKQKSEAPKFEKRTAQKLKPRKINERENYDCINLDRQNDTAAGRCRSAKCIARILHANDRTKQKKEANATKCIRSRDAPKLTCQSAARVWLGVCSLCSCASQYVYLFLSFATANSRKFRRQHQTLRLRSESTRSHFYFLEFVFRQRTHTRT